MILQVLLDSLVLGALYALMAVSYTLIFGVIRIVNFAQGELITLGAFGALGGWAATGGLPVAVRLAAAAAGGLAASVGAGLAMERLVFRPLLRRDSPALLGLIASLGLSLFIQNVLRLGISSADLRFPQPGWAPIWHVGSAVAQPVQAAVVAVSLVACGATDRFIRGTRLGLRVVAVRENRDLAVAQGVSVAAVLRGVFVAASVLASAAGVLLGLYYGVARYDMGFLPGIKAFVACIMGGLGNVRGAALAGLALGLVEGFGAAYVSSAYRDGFAFVLLVAVLLARPKGLLSEEAAR